MKNKLIIAFAIFSWLFAAGMILYQVLTANIPFWYDPARDMLSAWANLSKITLIGSTSGIPGFFYGPYWIWWLSLGELISKDPKIVTLITTSVPYLIVLPIVLYFLSKMYGKVTSILLGLLYVFSFQGYMTSLWNPNLAPLMFLTVITILSFQSFAPLRKKTLLAIFISGLLTGLALNIHISFSVGFTMGCLIYLVITSFLQKEKFITQIQQFLVSISSFILGIIVMFVPFFIFEIRHGFMQIKVALNAFSHRGAVVNLHGLTHQEIIYSFFEKFAILLQMPFYISIILLIATAGILIYASVYRKQAYSTREKQNLLLLICITISFLSVYIIAKNPIWSYHFLGADMLCLLFIGFIVSKIRIAKYILLFWVLYLTFFQVRGLVSSTYVNPLTRGSLYTKEYIVKTIQKDGREADYTVYAYSPSIYTYEYDYLFRWLTKKEFSYDPAQVQRKGNVYLILPPSKQSALDDFIHFRTPDALYTTTKQWQIPDGTIILKRSPKQ